MLTRERRRPSGRSHGGEKARFGRGRWKERAKTYVYVEGDVNVIGLRSDQRGKERLPRGEDTVDDVSKMIACESTSHVRKTVSFRTG
jgi:hypothetical protein